MHAPTLTHVCTDEYHHECQVKLFDIYCVIWVIFAIPTFPYGKNFNLHTLIQWPHKTYIESQHINYDNFLIIQFSLWSFLKSFWKLAFAIRIIIKLIKKNILKFVLKTFYLRHPPKVVKVLLFIRISSFKLTFKITNV